MKTSKIKSGKKCRDRSAESCLRTSSVSEWRPQELVLILHLAESCLRTSSVSEWHPQELVLILHLAGDGTFFWQFFWLMTYSNVMTPIF